MEEEIEELGFCEFITKVHRCVDDRHIAILENIDGEVEYYYDQNGKAIGRYAVIDTETWCITSWSLQIGDTRCESTCTELFCERWEDEEPEYPYCDD
jgi:hypothetical protein